MLDRSGIHQGWMWVVAFSVWEGEKCVLCSASFGMLRYVLLFNLAVQGDRLGVNGNFWGWRIIMGLEGMGGMAGCWGHGMAGCW